LLERPQDQVLRVAGIDDVDPGDVGRVGGGAVVGPWVARHEHQLAALVDVHVLVLPEGPVDVARQLEFLGG
jgi:hypothetical protein